ncbi:hypothetical protein LMH73_014470 [Vibrio splendidus]|nr:hypothetical protein [Vibrio splendidus]MCC4882501.1 hypothetical protein [Vibrio splendidus]
MNFEQSWIALENHNAFKVRTHTALADMHPSLRDLLPEQDGEHLTVESEIIHKLMTISYCQIDKAICVSLWQPKAVDGGVDINMDKESLSVESESFEACIIELAKLAEDLIVTDMLDITINMQNH